jgi:preprotein translocase subunit SecE
VSNWYIKLLIWVAVVGVAFAIAWRKGYLARVADYVRETREELRKCTWPSLEELKGSTVVVMVAMGLLAAFTIGADFILSQLIRLML